MSGSIACYKACDLLSRLRQEGFELEVVVTPSALEFIGEATIEGLTGKRVHTAVFESGMNMDHIRLARWADLLLLCPATANSLAKLAAGIADDLISTIFLAHDFTKPYLIAPAMNAAMFAHPAVRAAVAKLRLWGIDVLDCGDGALACGESGEGRLLEPVKLFSLIEARLAAAPPRSDLRAPVRRSLAVLVTSGGTREPIDRIRFITNASTGRTGAAIANYFAGRGHRVTLLRAAGAVSATAPVSERTFETFDELSSLLRTELSSASYDAVIHAAAVGDFAVEETLAHPDIANSAKIESTEPFLIKLSPRPKLIDGLRALSMNSAIKIVALKLTCGADGPRRELEVRKLAQRARPDFIVHNDFTSVGVDSHPATVYAVTENGEVVQPVATVANRLEMAAELEALL